MSKRGFSIIELLIVVGIIAVIVGLLLPALQKAVQEARSVQCLSNLRQIGQAVMQYANDNQGVMVPARWYPTGIPPIPDYPSYWYACPSDTVLLGKYTDPAEGVTYNTRQVWGMISTGRSVWLCPNDPKVQSGFIQVANINAPGAAQVSYALYINEYTTVSAGATGSWWKITCVRSPSKMLSFIEATESSGFNPGGGFYGNPMDYANNYSIGQPACYDNHAIRHPNNGTNALFIDGHADTLLNTCSAGNYSLLPAYNSGQFVLDRAN